MLDFGFSEILLTSAIALVVLGPERLPKVARQVGNWMGRARLMARQLSEQLEREVNAEELLKESTKPARAIGQPALSIPAPQAPAPPAAPPPPEAQAPAEAAPPEVAPPEVAPPPMASPPPAVINPYLDPRTTTAAAMHPVTATAPASVDPKQSSQ
jgi:sec-independent protein translocase protein TatB